MEEFMGEFDADIREFEDFTEIVAGNDITDTEWSKAARLPQPRIAELRRMLRMMHEEGLTQEEASKRIRRECTHIKLNKLYRGLCKILGEDYMTRQLVRLIKTTKDRRLRVTYMVSALSDKQLPEAEKLLSGLHGESDEAQKAKKKKDR
jgi:hypothetical protein